MFYLLALALTIAAAAVAIRFAYGTRLAPNDRVLRAAIAAACFGVGSAVLLVDVGVVPGDSAALDGPMTLVGLAAWLASIPFEVSALWVIARRVRSVPVRVSVLSGLLTLLALAGTWHREFL